MADQQNNAAAQPDELNNTGTPGSQSSSGTTDRINDSLVEAHQREKQERGEKLDVPASALSGAVGQDQDAKESKPGSPINRDPEATTGPVVD